MPPIFVGKPSESEKILRKSSFTKEVDGLILLTEAYTVKRGNSQTILAGISIDASHASISTASPTYSDLFVESARIDPMDGGFDSLIINYGGLFSTTLPPAYVEYIGNPGAGVYGPDFSIVVKYVANEDIGTIIGQTSPMGTISVPNQVGQEGETIVFASGFSVSPPVGRFMPNTINGTALPLSPSLRRFSANFNTQTFEYDIFIYGGYCQSQISSKKRGLYYQIEETFTEWAYATENFYDRFGKLDKNIVDNYKFDGALQRNF